VVLPATRSYRAPFVQFLRSAQVESVVVAEARNMGKLAQKLGVGVKGDISVVHEKEVYMAGETVIGVVKVHITQPVECGGASALIDGSFVWLSSSILTDSCH
jgi:hypothetical protein